MIYIRVHRDEIVGQIVVDVSVCSAVETQAEIAALGEFSLKGFARPVKAFNITSVKF